MITIGQTHTLSIIKMLDFGAYLYAGELGEVLLPYKYTPGNVSTGDAIEVFLYLDSEDRIVATTQVPKVKVGQFAYLKVIDCNRFGIFLDWGLDKDLLVPFAEQKTPMQEGHSYLIYVYINRFDDRIVASAKLDKFIDENIKHNFKPHQAVDLIIANSTDLGYKAIINHNHWGVLYKNEVFQKLSFGQSIKGFIKQVRADGKIDLSLHSGQKTRDKDVQLVLAYLKNKNGFVPLHDKSEAKLITKTFGISKGAFKKAIGYLYKQRIISIKKEGIFLNKD